MKDYREQSESTRRYRQMRAAIIEGLKFVAGVGLLMLLFMAPAIWG